VLAVELAVIVMFDVPEPGAAMGVGLKLTVTPLGWPVADKAIDELNPPETDVVIVELPWLPCTTETEVGEAEMVKFAGTEAVTVRLTVAVLVRPPPVPVIVIGYVPVAVLEAALMVIVEVPEPGAAPGLEVSWPRPREFAAVDCKSEVALPYRRHPPMRVSALFSEDFRPISYPTMPLPLELRGHTPGNRHIGTFRRRL
jgi:hypothetical protein